MFQKVFRIKNICDIPYSSIVCTILGGLTYRRKMDKFSAGGGRKNIFTQPTHTHRHTYRRDGGADATAAAAAAAELSDAASDDGH